jgi:hypothetical protein
MAQIISHRQPTGNRAARRGRPPAKFNELLVPQSRLASAVASIKRANVLDLVDWYVQAVDQDVKRRCPRSTTLNKPLTPSKHGCSAACAAAGTATAKEPRPLADALLRQVTARGAAGPSRRSADRQLRRLARAALAVYACAGWHFGCAGGVGAGKAVVEQWRGRSTSDWVAAADLGVGQADRRSQACWKNGTQAGLRRRPADRSRSRRTPPAESRSLRSRQLHQIEHTLEDVTQNARGGEQACFICARCCSACCQRRCWRLAYNFL